MSIFKGIIIGYLAIGIVLSIASEIRVSRYAKANSDLDIIKTYEELQSNYKWVRWTTMLLNILLLPLLVMVMCAKKLWNGIL